MSTSRMTTRQEPLAKPLRDGIRRKRIVLSCLTCKGRKVRCDRQAPVCMRCIEAGYPERCRYDERSIPSSDDNLPAARTPSPVFVSSPTPAHHTRNVFPARTDFPTATSNAGTHPYDSQPDHPPNISPRGSHIPVTPPTSTNPTTVAGDDDPTTEPNSGRPLIQGASLNTQFHGMTHSINIIGYFDGLRAFLQRTATDHPVLGAHRWAVQNLAKERHQQGSLFEVPEAVLKRSLPPEPVCRSLMITYFQHFEGIFRILHAPSFWRHYDAFWAQSTNHLSSFTALLLSAISCARCLYVDNPLSFDGDCSASRAEAIRWVRAAESWHDQQSPKHTTLDIIQIKCLIMLSKRVNAIKLKRHYTESQTLLANAISIGLHRSPSSLGDRASVYEKEMRRRLWGTISELELAESMERGVPSLVASLYSDIEPPANIKDEEFDETTTSDLVLQDDKTMTASSFARYAHQFRPLQHTINNVINNPERHKSLSPAELNTYHEQIFNRFFDLQPWPTSRGSSNHSDASFLGCIFIQVQLHKLLIMLHLPFSVGQPPSVTTSHSRLVCGNSSKAVIGIYTRLADQGYSQICLPRTDLMRATLCLCLIESTATSFGMCLPRSRPMPRRTLIFHLFEKNKTISEHRLTGGSDRNDLHSSTAQSIAHTSDRISSQPRRRAHPRPRRWLQRFLAYLRRQLLHLSVAHLIVPGQKLLPRFTIPEFEPPTESL